MKSPKKTVYIIGCPSVQDKPQFDAKYIETLLISGQVKAKIDGTSKVNTFSQREPVSAMMGFSSDMSKIKVVGSFVQMNV